MLRHFATRGEPGERLPVRCRNRRASRCPACSYQYAGDTFHLVRAGLIGGKGVPGLVAARPRVFVTLTAPGFGRVHRAGKCHRRRSGLCEHGAPAGCGQVHDDADPQVGQALCPGCYDYVGHVLWNAHAGRLWKAFGDNVYHHLAQVGGVDRSAVRRLLRVSAVKVAEFQRRGAVHFHAVVRLDGPHGPGSGPPGWATVGALLDVVRTAAAAVALSAPPSTAYGTRRLVFGEQLEAHLLSGTDGADLTDGRIAGYLAKYVTKSVTDAGTLDRRITSATQVRALRASDHVRALVGTCWRLGSLPELQHLRLRAWAHMLGYRGWCVTKTRAYSTTYGALRAERAAHTGAGVLPAAGVVVERSWHYVSSGHTPAEALIAAGTASDLARTREIAHDLPPGWAGGARREPSRAGGPSPGTDDQGDGSHGG